MKLINFAEKQMEYKEPYFINESFFKEYFRSFNSNTNFAEDTQQLMQAYTIQNVSETVSFLKLKTKEIIHHINKSLSSDIDLDIIVFFGDCSYDSHGILINNKPYVFLDLNAIIPRLDFYNFNAFITHEVLHGVHYALNPEFYRGNYQTVEEKYLKLLFAEGVATHLSYIISKEKIEDTYWFGFLESEQVQEWVENCEKMKNNIGNDLHKAIQMDKLDNNLYKCLFEIEDFTMITSYRMGYYYGAEIVKDLFAERSINEVLLLNYSEVKEIIKKYF